MRSSSAGFRKQFLPLIGAILLMVGCAAPALGHENHRSASASSAAATTIPADVSDEAPMAMAWPTDGATNALPEKPKSFGQRVTSWLGAWHPAVIHFPIALLLTVALLEAASAVRSKPVYSAGNKMLLGFATVGGFAAAGLGWANAGLPSPNDEAALTLHRWLGTVIPFVYLLLWRLKPRAETAAERPSSRLYEIALAVSVVLILTQAYLGGDVTHGANHLAF